MALFYINKFMAEKEYIDVYVNGNKLDDTVDTFESHLGLVHIKAVHRRPLAHEEKVGKEIVTRYLRRGYEVCKYENIMPPYFCVTEANVMPQDDKVHLEVSLQKSKLSLKCNGGQMLGYKSKFDITKRALVRTILYSLVNLVLAPIILFICLIGQDTIFGNTSEFWIRVELILIAVGTLIVLTIPIYYVIRSICIYVKNKPQR